MTIEIVDFPIENGGSFHSYVNVYQRVLPFVASNFSKFIVSNHWIRTLLKRTIPLVPMLQKTEPQKLATAMTTEIFVNLPLTKLEIVGVCTVCGICYRIPASDRQQDFMQRPKILLVHLQRQSNSLDSQMSDGNVHLPHCCSKNYFWFQLHYIHRNQKTWFPGALCLCTLR